MLPVHVERARLPDPPLILELGLGDGFEECLAGLARYALSPPDCREYCLGSTAHLATLMVPAPATLFQTYSPRYWL